ncbi:FRG domain-containing protein [Aurantimonas manganoxydans]|nr:FRG domain-containing protein [Aurantimonas manganoxydans]
MFSGAIYVDSSDCNEVHFENPEEFLSCLSVIPFRQKPVWGSDSRRGGKWLFRGHWDEAWALKPSAHRNAQPFYDIGLKKLPERSVVRHDQYWPKMVESEVFALRKFMTLANSSSLPCEFSAEILDEIAEMRKDVQGNYYRNMEFFPKSKWYPIMARAQHHGMPTRLLDFSSDGLYAAFFAGIRRWNVQDSEENLEGKLCVWAFFTSDFADLDSEPDTDTESKRWLEVPAISQLGSNLASQRGSLILHEGANNYYSKNGEWPDFFSSSGDGPDPDRKRNFLKLTLDRPKVKQMLCCLVRHDVTPVRIYPSLDNVTATLKYRSWLSI